MKQMVIYSEVLLFDIKMNKLKCTHKSFKEERNKQQHSKGQSMKTFSTLDHIWGIESNEPLAWFEFLMKSQSINS